MATGNEVVLGFHSSRRKEILDILAEKYNVAYIERTYNAAYTSGSFIDLDDTAKINKLLKLAWQDALRSANMVLQSDISKQHARVLTPAGIRDMIPFCLELLHDDGDHENAILGVAVSGRYFPTFIDYQDKHGTLINVPLNLDLMAIAKESIITHIPEFKSAEWFVVQIFY